MPIQWSLHHLAISLICCIVLSLSIGIFPSNPSHIGTAHLGMMRQEEGWRV